MKRLAVLLVGMVIVFFSEGYAQAAQAASATVRIGVVDLQKFSENFESLSENGIGSQEKVRRDAAEARSGKRRSCET